MRLVFVAIIVCLLQSQSVEGQSSPPLSPEQAQRLDDLEGKRVSQLDGHVELAEYLMLRQIALGSDLPRPEASVVHFTTKRLGTEYSRNARMFDLIEADCVTWTEHVLSLALTDNWEDAYRLHFRLRFRDGDRRFMNLNQYPIADWLPNNGWLFEDVTERLGAPVVPLDVVTNRQQKYADHAASFNEEATVVASSRGSLSAAEVTLVTSYVPKEHALPAYRRLRDGDLMLFISNYPDPTDGFDRPLCMHQGIVHVADGRITLLHCIQPEAIESNLHEFVMTRIEQDRYLGFKIVRLKPDARALVVAELTDYSTTMKTPQRMDSRRGRKWKDATGKSRTHVYRAPDRQVEIDGVVYGAIAVDLTDRLYFIFRGRWERVYNLPVNAPFRRANPDPHNLAQGGVEILFPIRDAQ